jgi:hypothetical protein
LKIASKSHDNKLQELVQSECPLSRSKSMGEAVAEYLALTRQILEARKRSLEPIEDSLLPRLDAIWEAMNEDERSQADEAARRLVL